MNDDDIEVRAFAEKNTNPGDWDMAVRFEGECLIGCTTRKMLRTKNMLAALRWADYHKHGKEHIKLLLERRSNGAGADRHEHTMGTTET